VGISGRIDRAVPHNNTNKLPSGRPN